MSPDKERKLLVSLVRFHFAYLVAVPLLGIISWWFLARPLVGWMIASGFAAIAAYYSLQAERYQLTAHLPSALWVVFSSPLLLLVSSLLGGGFWYFYLDAAYVEVGGMCAGIIAGATVKGLKEREYFYMGVLYTFMGGFLLAWGWGLAKLHRNFAWYDNIWLILALANEIYIYSRMFISGELDLEYGHGRAAQRAGADLLPAPFKDDGAWLIGMFAILVVLSPFVLGLLNYLFK
ncbi:MAG TPA: hypothetical protein VF766_15970 [Pyrinomonadaceae bacterium]